LRAYIVVDLGFGDAGKGLLTDFLARHFEAGLVVRYNGGAQAGHNVVAPDGRHHTFTQFGSGTFVPNVKTYLSRQVVIDPLALLFEGDALEGKRVQDVFSRLRISDQALVITPFHRAANRIRELARGADRHGSCGIGVGEAFEDALTYPENRVLAGDLKNPALLQKKMGDIRDLKHEQILTLGKDNSFDLSTVQEYEVFERDDLIDSWVTAIARIGELGLVASDSTLAGWFREVDTFIFEGAQGVLLDADAGFHPYTTWSNCTAANAVELLDQFAPDARVTRIGVLRSYAVRHGPGPLPTEDASLASFVSEHNQYNDWQRAVRYGWFDAVLARYALAVTGGVDTLAVTHMDILPRLKTWKYCPGYQELQVLNKTAITSTISDSLLTDFQLPPDLSLAERAQFTEVLSKAAPVFNTCNADDEAVIKEIEELLDQQVRIISYGPKAENIRMLNSFLE